MSAKIVNVAGQRAIQSDSISPIDDLRKLIWGSETHEASAWTSPVEQLFLEFNQGCLKRNEWLTCVRTAVLSLDPSEQQAIKEQLMDLYLSADDGNSLSSKERENFAVAWIHAADAGRAVVGGLGDAVQAHLVGAYTLLAANLKIRARRNIFGNKAKGRQECIEEFAKLAHAKRPAGGWKGERAFAEALNEALGDIIDKKNSECGPLFRKIPVELIYEWLAKLKGPVYEAYRGRKS